MIIICTLCLSPSALLCSSYDDYFDRFICFLVVVLYIRWILVGKRTLKKRDLEPFPSGSGRTIILLYFSKPETLALGLTEWSFTVSLSLAHSQLAHAPRIFPGRTHNGKDFPLAYLGRDIRNFPHDSLELGRLLRLLLVVQGNFLAEFPRIRHCCWWFFQAIIIIGSIPRVWVFFSSRGNFRRFRIRRTSWSTFVF